MTKKKPVTFFMFGRNDESHRMIGATLGESGEYDVTLLLEDERCLGTRLDLWNCTHLSLDRAKEMIRSARKRNYKVGICKRVGNGPYKEIEVESDRAMSVRAALDRHPGRAKARAAVRKLIELRKIKVGCI